MSKPFSHRVFSAIEAETIYKEFPFIGITPPFWTPSEEDTALLDGTVNELRSLLMKRGMDIDLRDYEWQHIGFYRGSDKVIYANLFCRDAKHDPRVFVVSFDGGSCYLQVRFDIKSRQFFDLEVNEDA